MDYERLFSIQPLIACSAGAKNAPGDDIGRTNSLYTGIIKKGFPATGVARGMFLSSGEGIVKS